MVGNECYPPSRIGIADMEAGGDASNTGADDYNGFLHGLTHLLKTGCEAENSSAWALNRALARTCYSRAAASRHVLAGFRSILPHQHADPPNITNITLSLVAKMDDDEDNGSTIIKSTVHSS